MHDHDLDLIAALADGAAPEDAGKAAELVESCPICRAEFRLQQRTRAGLRSLPPVHLDATERALLHRRVSAAVSGGGRQGAAAARAWLRLAPVAAALALVVGVAAVLGSQRSHAPSQGETAAFGQAEAAAPDTKAPEDTTLTTAAAAVGADAQARVLAAPGVPHLGIVDLTELVRRLPSEGVAPDALDSTPPCLSKPRGAVLRVAMATVGEREVVAFLVAGDPETVETYDPQACAFVTGATVP